MPNARFRKAKKIRTILCAHMEIITCHWCHCALTFETCTLDHLIPVSAGGHDELENAVIACAPCNRRREAVVDPSVVSWRRLARNKKRKAKALAAAPAHYRCYRVKEKSFASTSPPRKIRVAYKHTLAGEAAWQL